MSYPLHSWENYEPEPLRDSKLLCESELYCK